VLSLATVLVRLERGGDHHPRGPALDGELIGASVRTDAREAIRDALAEAADAIADELLERIPAKEAIVFREEFGPTRLWLRLGDRMNP
jgi:hypothetical protein